MLCLFGDEGARVGTNPHQSHWNWSTQQHFSYRRVAPLNKTQMDGIFIQCRCRLYFPSQLVFVTHQDKVKHQLLIGSTYLYSFVFCSHPPQKHALKPEKMVVFFFPWGTSFKKSLPWKTHGKSTVTPPMEKPQEGNLGAPVLFAAQDGALPESHRQELLEARWNADVPTGWWLPVGLFTKKLKHLKCSNLHFWEIWFKGHQIDGGEVAVQHGMFLFWYFWLPKMLIRHSLCFNTSRGKAAIPVF